MRKNINQNRKKKVSNNKEISLTIAIPTLNSAKTLNIPMKSLLNQEKNGFKINTVLLDSGSEDDTKIIFDSYRDKLDLTFEDIGKCSIGKARNYAIEFFKTDYLIFLDSDDALIYNRLSFDYELIKRLKKPDFIYGDSLQINKKSFKSSYYCKSSKFAEQYQFLNIPYNLSSLTVSRNFLLNNRIDFKTGREGRLGEDWRFINQINSKSENYLYSPYPKVIINSREDSHTQDFLRCDLNISKIELICDLFVTIRNKRKLLTLLFFSAQIQSSFILALLNICRYTYPKEIKNFSKNMKKISIAYKKISFLYILINMFLFPISLYLIFFVHRRSIYSPLRSNISLNSYKNFTAYL